MNEIIERFEFDTLALLRNNDNIKVSKVAIVFNPYGGNGRAKKLHARLLLELEKNKVEQVSYPTERAGHAIELCKSEIKDFHDALVVIGGDGTLYECLNGYGGRKCIIWNYFKKKVCGFRNPPEWCQLVTIFKIARH